MKFGKEFTAQMVPEWQQAYMDYSMLKNLLKEIHRYRQQRNSSASASASAAAAAAGGGGRGQGLKRKMTMYRAFSGLTRRYSNLKSGGGGGGGGEEQVILVNNNGMDDDHQRYETMFLMTSDEGGEYEMVFFKRLDDEFNKANTFYRTKVDEVMAEADSLTKQMNALIAFRLRVENPSTYHHGHMGISSPNTPSPSPSPSPLSSLSPNNSSSSSTGPSPADLIPATPTRRLGKAAHMDVIQEVEMSGEGFLREITEESVMVVDERDNHKTIPETRPRRKPSKPAPLELLNHVKINVALETPRSTIKGMLMDSKHRELSFSKEELKKAEEQLKRAFVEFHQKLRLLKSYSFLNLLAFSKIMKKYDKITTRSASRSFLNMVDNSYLGSSDEVTRLLERVEATFIKHFSNSNRRKGMKTLRPAARRERHRITFLLGFAAGCSLALLIALILMVRAWNIYNSTKESQRYMNTMFPLYSLFGFIVLHMLMYAANIYFWRRYRVNYPFIFGFKQGTELGYREVFFLSTSLAVLALAGVLANLNVEVDYNTEARTTLTRWVPLGLVTLVLLLTFCPFNIIYSSSRFFLLRCAFHCICAPLYKVTLPDFFLADQLTSQVQAIRSLEFYICYYGWGNFELCENDREGHPVFKSFYFIVAVIPYWARFLQCVRRMFEEKDAMQGYNGLKYFATIIAVVMRTTYEANRVIHWRVMAGISSIVATIVSIYWDIVLDWGLLQKNSKNRWLRDKLLVPHRSVYFAAMVLNILLRFAWLQSVFRFRVSFLNDKALATTFACLEIIRRGIWNFFRLENEHLNNVGKYRAFKSVPLPFNYDTDDEKDE